MNNRICHGCGASVAVRDPVPREAVCEAGAAAPAPGTPKGPAAEARAKLDALFRDPDADAGEE